MLNAGDLVKLLCISGHYHGFALLLTCLNTAMKNENLLDSLTKHLYPLVAEQHGTTVGHVTSSIRNLIKIWWKRGNRNFLPPCIASGNRPPGNKAFLHALIAHLQHAEASNP